VEFVSGLEFVSKRNETSWIFWLSLLGLGACQTVAPAEAPEKVEVFIKGSDIDTPENSATRELRDSVEALVAARQDLILSSPGQSDLAVWIPELVAIDRSSGVENVVFGARLSRRVDGKVAELSGSCERSNVSACAKTIVDALAALSLTPYR
jgi:hypothetical protein